MTAVLDPITLRFGLLIGGLLTAAAPALALASRRWGRERTAPVWLTYRSWLVMLPLLLVTVAAGRTAVILGVTLLAIAGFREFARTTGLAQDRWLTGGVYLTLVAVAMLCWMPDPRTGADGWYGLFMALPAYGVCWLLALPILRGRGRGQLHNLALAILAFIYLGWMLGHAAFLANAEAFRGYLLFLALAVIANDVAAFCFGRCFGRHKLRPEISPGKTWEGALGAFAVSMALPWVLAFALPHFGPVQRLLTGLIVGVGGQLGDLAISVIKRDLGIKDMGSSIPGHGGILDRVDSLIFTAPLFFHMVRWFYDLH